MTTPWNTFAGQTAVHEPPAQAEAWQTAPQQPTQPALHQPYHQPAFQQPAFEQFPPAGQPFAQGGMPPQGPGFNGFNGFNGGQPPKTNRTPLIISLVVAAVLLIGGGVGAFFLLNKKSDPANNAANVVTTQSAATSSNTISTPTDTTTTQTTPTTQTTTQHTTTQHTTTQHTTTSPTTDAPSTGSADLATAQVVAQTWVGYLNDADYETAAALVCESQRTDFVASFNGEPMKNQIEVVSVEPSGDNVTLTIGAAGIADATSQVTMWPTNTGYFLICDGPLSATDQNWGSE